MLSISDQVKWEQECVQRGADTYYEKQDRLRDTGRAEHTDAIQYVMRTRLGEVGASIEEDVASGRAGIESRYNAALRYAMEEGVSAYALAFLGMQIVIRAIAEGKRKNHNRVTKICGSIGERVETELRCIKMEAAEPAWFDLLLKGMAETGTTSYEHKRKTILRRMRHINTGDPWSSAVKVGVGAKILSAVELVMGDLIYISKVNEGRKMVSIISVTDAFDEWTAEFEKEKGLLEPRLLPLKIEPLDWDTEYVGGYYTPRMQMRFPFIKTKGREHREFVAKYNPEQHIAAVNKMQKTAWVINTDILKVVEYVFSQGLSWHLPSAKPVVIPSMPEDLEGVARKDFDEEMEAELKYWKGQAKMAHREEAKRKGQVLQFLQTLKLAREVTHWDKFYFAYSCDFRGRVYCATTCLSPQSNGIARSLLKFKEEITLGESGVVWLALHGANQWGVKGTYETRLAWVSTANQMVKLIVEDPINNNWWIQADEPYQFLAWCYEWAKCGYGQDTTAKSNLVVGIDGSCNGLQHFSAILRDPKGAHATNLSDSETPQDIYQEVADGVVAKLNAVTDGMSELWQRVGVTRSTTKRQTMTLPYGATQQSCRDYTYEWVNEHWDDFELPRRERWKVASYCSPLIWQSIGETVVAARVAMDWLQRNTSARYMKWVSPVGFPVYQFYKKVKTERVDTKIAGKTKLTIHNMEKQGKPNIYKQKLGIVPNFIHSVDASHMVMTINGTELPAYSMIHDEFGCHAGYVQQLYSATRLEFYRLHFHCNPLELWATHQGIPLECVPPRGTFDIEEVLRSKYIFG
ncbi:RNA polymerase [Vibrio phage K436]